jgi:hypothetical protein
MCTYIRRIKIPQTAATTLEFSSRMSTRSLYLNLRHRFPNQQELGGVAT